MNGGQRFSFAFVPQENLGNPFDGEPHFIMPRYGIHGEGFVYLEENPESIYVEDNLYLKTNKIMDDNAGRLLINMEMNKFSGDYGLFGNNCITFSRNMFDFFKINQEKLSTKKYRGVELIIMYYHYFELFADLPLDKLKY